MSANRARSGHAGDFLPGEGEDFFPPIVDDWMRQKGLVMFRIGQNAEAIKVVKDGLHQEIADCDDKMTARIDKINEDLQALKLKHQYQVGRIVGAAIVASFILTFLLQYFQVFAPGTVIP